MSKLDSPAAERNREPILRVLESWLPERARVLEVASGTGQHAAFFAQRLPHVTWQPSERDPGLLDSIRAWSEDAQVDNLAAPVQLDACDESWPVGRFDALFNANMIHISPWRVLLGLLAGAARHLEPGGLLFVYGPFRIAGAHTAPSNAAFDEDLRRRDPSWGVRDLEDVREAAAERGLELVGREAMPANNLTLVLRLS